MGMTFLNVVFFLIQGKVGVLNTVSCILYARTVKVSCMLLLKEYPLTGLPALPSFADASLGKAGDPRGEVPIKSLNALSAFLAFCYTLLKQASQYVTEKPHR